MSPGCLDQVRHEGHPRHPRPRDHQQREARHHAQRQGRPNIFVTTKYFPCAGHVDADPAQCGDQGPGAVHVPGEHGGM